MYLVKEVHGCNDFIIIGVCPNRELAEMLRQKNENLWDLEDCEITGEVWDHMVQRYYDSGGYNDTRPMLEVLYEMFPEYSISNIDNACRGYDNRSYTSTIIEEINLYATDSDITLYGINY